MRPNKVGWVLAFGFLIGGIAFWFTIPEIFIGQIWVGVAVLLMVLYTFMNRRADRVARLRATGIPGTARILELTQTGTYVNNQPMVKFRLRIEAPGVATFEDERREIVPLVALGMLSSGGTLPVYIEPADHSRYVIDWGAGITGAAAGTTATATSVGASQADGLAPAEDRLRELQELKDDGLITDDEFQRQRRRILDDI